MINHASPVDEVFVIFEDHLCDSNQTRSLKFAGRAPVYTCNSADKLETTFSAIEQAVADGYWVVMAAHYELGYLLEPKALGRPFFADVPLLTAYVFDQPEALTRSEADALINARLTDQDTCTIAEVHASVNDDEFVNCIRRILDYIADGDCYQINYTYSLSFEWYGSPLALYARLRVRQPVRYAAYIETQQSAILSLSPELFLQRRGNRLVSKPMKGTAARGRSEDEDDVFRARLATSEKDRAENVMIVDLIRNDLGRVAKVGSVRVERLFDIESYPTVFQMTSTVSAELLTCSLAEIFHALFPCGSVTGAPKVRAMQIIAELERRPRGIYTGALGYIAPSGDFEFNVAIRTVVLDRNGRGRLGIGSGIVFDSEPESELAECRLKAAFLTELDSGFDLIETMRYDPAHCYPHLDLHLERLTASARHFGFSCAIEEVRAQLLRHVRGAGGARRVRLLLARNGGCHIESALLPAESADQQWKVVLSPYRVNSRDIFLYHKSTRRTLYDSELGRIAALPDCFDVLFCNERGELTEGARSNLLLRLAGTLYTPPISAGLLNGVMRRALLGRGDLGIVEKTLHPSDLARAEAIYVCNAVRGLVRVRLCVCPANGDAVGEGHRDDRFVATDEGFIAPREDGTRNICSNG